MKSPLRRKRQRALKGKVAHNRPHCFNARLQTEPLEERRMLSASPELLADLGGGDDSSIRSAIEVNGVYYFSLRDGQTSDSPSRLWRSDGTADGTWVIRDFTDYHPTSGAVLPVNFNGTLFFRGPGAGGAIWKTDGTAAGTEIVKENVGWIRPVVVGDTLIFADYDNRLWRSDGTSAGTTIIASFGPTSPTTLSTNLTLVGDEVYFTAEGPADAAQLWRSDGTTAGTVLVKEFATGIYEVSLAASIGFEGRVFFSVGDPTAGGELWVSDGTEAGTTLVKDIRPGVGSSSPRSFVEYADELYFVANDGTHGGELWKTDGTETGTVMVTDIVTSTAVVGAPVVLEDAMFFGAANKLWKTDESGSPEIVTDGAVSGLRRIGEQLFFSRKPLNGAASLWASDGTSEGTILVKQVALVSNAYPAEVNGQFMFVGSDGITGAELWRSDGTTEGTHIVKDLSPKRTRNSSARDFTSVGEKTFFVANDGAAGQELWVTDGSSPHLVKDIVSGPTSSEILYLTNLDGVLLFTVQDEELWRSDGTLAGTYQLSDAEFGSHPPGSLTGGSDTAFVIANGVAYFAARTPGIGTALWRTDGTTVGTYQVKDINPTGQISRLDLGVNVNGIVYFAADDGVHGVELWRSDGNESGTSLVKDIRTDASAYGSYPADFTNVDGVLYFVAADQDLGENTDPNEEIWTSDGTTAGTHVLVEIVAGPLGSAPDMLQNVGGTLFFLAAVTPGVYELWTTDGSAAGTRRFKETFFASHGPAVELNGLWYLAADDGVHGTELWVTDGVSTASLVKDIAPGAIGSGVYELTVLNGKLYFRSDDGTIGPELWQSDGTSAGTMPVADLRVGSSGSLPTYLTASGSRLYFAAQDGVTGVDPWFLETAASVVSRQLFYNNSGFDGQSVAAESADDGAIATDKIAHLPDSGLATTASVSSYSRGINGLMIDVANLDGALTADDFTFRVGTSNSPDTWGLAPAPLEVVVRAGAGANGSDRVTITWADGAIKNTWLQVVVKGNDALGGFNTNTGLKASDVFYFGSRIGDTFENAAPLVAVTSAFDEIQARTHAGFSLPITNHYDFNRDGIVSAADQVIARSNGGFLPMLDLSPPEAAPLVAASPLHSESEAISVSKGSPSHASLDRSAVAFALATLGTGEAFGDDAIAALFSDGALGRRSLRR